LYEREWNATTQHFVEVLPGEASGSGISATGGQPQQVALAVGSDGRALLGWQDAAAGGATNSPEILARGDAAPVSRTFVADAGTSVQSILDSQALGAGDVIIVTGTQAGFTVSAGDAGVLIWGAANSRVSGDVVVNGANVTLQHLTLGATLTIAANGTGLSDSTVTGAVNLASGSGAVLTGNRLSGGVAIAAGVQNASLRLNTISGGLLLDSATGVQIRDNTISGPSYALRLVGGSTASGRIAGNTFNATATGLDLLATFTGLIENNKVQGGALGINYAAANQLAGNTVSGATVGLQTALTGNAALGFFGASLDRPNTFDGNATGLKLVGSAVVQGQVISHNTVGVTGAGQLGGGTADHMNLIQANVTGVNAFTGTVQFNRLSANQTAINATSEQRILHNIFDRNTLVGVEINGRNDVRVFNNTFYALTGDNLRTEGGSTEVEVQNNVMWAAGGYDLYIANDSRYGIFSDYNDLFTSGSGKIGFWAKDFTDILDWQMDLDRLDLNSIGTTVVNPVWAEPAFVSILTNDFRLRDPVAAQRFSSPGIDMGNALVDNGRQTTDQNLLANPGFEGSLAGWEVNAGASAYVPSGSAPAAYEGSSFFFAGGVAGGFARQTFT
ncbi:right-handed parallel beta-helix repeat-containing protein, partial [Pelomonas sp. KK5]|uniref:right-handed parallel beta-helix repeat-containing protein n=1 Tax=Pelomonas sp. KK5 TaxID=1855730 RepID=UPI001301FA29